MKTLSLKLSDALYGDLSALAEHKGTSRSALVREAVLQLFRRERSPAQGSALSLLEGLVGSIDGPEDLSTNSLKLSDAPRGP